MIFSVARQWGSGQPHLVLLCPAGTEGNYQDCKSVGWGGREVGGSPASKAHRSLSGLSNTSAIWPLSVPYNYFPFPFLPWSHFRRKLLSIGLGSPQTMIFFFLSDISEIPVFTSNLWQLLPFAQRENGLVWDLYPGRLLPVGLSTSPLSTTHFVSWPNPRTFYII